MQKLTSKKKKKKKNTHKEANVCPKARYAENNDKTQDLSPTGVVLTCTLAPVACRGGGGGKGGLHHTAHQGWRPLCLANNLNFSKSNPKIQNIFKHPHPPPLHFRPYFQTRCSGSSSSLLLLPHVLSRLSRPSVRVWCDPLCLLLQPRRARPLAQLIRREVASL